jgi:hypothetical protein
MGAILRSPGAPPWNFRCRGAMLQVEDSLFIDGDGQPVPTLQLVVVGEISALAAKSPGSSAAQANQEGRTMTAIVPIRRALISLSDKTGLERWRGLAKAWGRAGLDRRHRRANFAKMA